MSLSGAFGATLDRIPPPVMAGLLMAAAALLFAVVNGFMRHWTQQVPPFEVAFFRTFFGLVFLLPILLRTGLVALKTDRHGLFLLRGVITGLQTIAWVYALYLLPVDKATALNFTVPIWATIGAALVLREAVGRRQWAAVGVGLLGSLIILRPGFAAYEPGSIVPLLAAASMGVSFLIVKSLSRTEAPHTVVLYMGLYSAPVSLVPALLVWQTPGAEFLFWVFFMAAMGTVGQLLVTRAFALADASVVAPYDFFRLPFSALVGFVWFGEIMDFWSWIGAGVIFAAAGYIAHREARLGKPDGLPTGAGGVRP